MRTPCLRHQRRFHTPRVALKVLRTPPPPSSALAIPETPASQQYEPRVTRDKGLSVRQYYKLVGDMFDLRSKWAAAVAAAGLDAVIFPPAALPALPHGGSRDLTPIFTYMFIANLLHWPAGVVPVAVVTDDEQVSAFHKHVSDRSFVFPLIHPFIHWFFVHLSFVTWLFHSSVHSFICLSFLHSLLLLSHSSIISLVFSFIISFIQ